MSQLELEEYAENTQTFLLYLVMEILDCAYATKSTSEHFIAVSHFGTFLQFAMLLKAIPWAAANGFIGVLFLFFCLFLKKCGLPDDVSSEFKLWQEEEAILKGKCTDNLKLAVEHVTGKALTHLSAAKNFKHLDSTVKSIFLTGVGPERFLHTLQKCGFDPFHKKLLKRDTGLSFRAALAWKAFRSEF
ncbi:hypothetical protein RFI_39456 [Reticulomyxa filosa]|uniref:Uncharacterized protein n=1 Tax=Reticulomyxa filosa TaxID=46433 RepID=X6L808_RETFI|nr:hypothetical protein RFI_39456 [Reticulomyxa filosa]|eukprot:ETN98067.1 hypothetical protein RFI_39456 [Reticulomyxa filosa]